MDDDSNKSPVNIPLKSIRCHHLSSWQARNSSKDEPILLNLVKAIPILSSINGVDMSPLFDHQLRMNSKWRSFFSTTMKEPFAPPPSVWPLVIAAVEKEYKEIFAHGGAHVSASIRYRMLQHLVSLGYFSSTYYTKNNNTAEENLNEEEQGNTHDGNVEDEDEEEVEDEDDSSLSNESRQDNRKRTRQNLNFANNSKATKRRETKGLLVYN